MKALWINGFEGLYAITTEGYIISCHNKSLLVLKPQDDGHGYNSYQLCKEGKKYNVKGYRMVAETFIANPENLPMVNHKNGIKNIDHIDNLEWVTYGENNQHAYDIGLKIKEGIRVYQYTLAGELLDSFTTVTEAAGRMLPNNTTAAKSSICKCCNGADGRKSAYGYKWAYE